MTTKKHIDTTLPSASEVAQILRETGMLLGASGQNAYRARAYLRGAEALESLERPLHAFIKDDNLQDIPGIGAGLAKSIKQIFERGDTSLHKDLTQALPINAGELMRIPGITLGRINALSRDLGITTIAQLEQALAAKKIREVKGFGLRVERSLADALKRMQSDDRSMLLVDAMSIARELIDYLQSQVPNIRVEITGALRQWQESLDEIELVVDGSNKKEVIKALKQYTAVESLNQDKTKGICRARLLSGADIQIHFSDTFELTLLALTNAGDFAKLQSAATDKGYVLTPDTMHKARGKTVVTTEAQVYSSLGIPFIPPEMRHGLDEINTACTSAGAKQIDNLIDITDIQGMVHCHSNFSDGRHSIEAMAKAAQKLGMQYITITDHSPTAHYAHGLSIDRLKEQWEEIDRVQQLVDIKILRGTELDILADGRLDYPDHILEKFDIIIASIHSRYRQDHTAMTRRVLRGLQNPYFKIWGHPLGRLVLRRDPIPVDLEQILEMVKDHKIALEISADPYRLDLSSANITLARKKGFRFVISVDAHSTNDLRNLEYGVHQARRAGVQRNEVLNTLAARVFAKHVRPR